MPAVHSLSRPVMALPSASYLTAGAHGARAVHFANFKPELNHLLTYAFAVFIVRKKNDQPSKQRPSNPANLRPRSYAEGDNGEHGDRLDHMAPLSDFAYHNPQPREVGPPDHIVRMQPRFDDSPRQQQSMPANSLYESSIPTRRQEPIRLAGDSNTSMHPGASELGFDGYGRVYMDIDGGRVSMRTEDHQIDVSQVFLASKLKKQQKINLREALEEHGIIAPRGRQIWVPFRDGVFACQATGIDQQLLPLLSYACLPFPDRNDNYLQINKRDRPLMEILEESPGFAGLKIGDNVVAYRPSERTINATQLIATKDPRRNKLFRFLKANRDIVTDRYAPHDRLRGTYISYEAAHRLCDHVGLSRDPIEQLISMEAARPEICSERAVFHHSGANGASSSCDLVDYDLGNGASTVITTYDSAHRESYTSLLGDSGVSFGSWLQLTEQDRVEELAAFDCDDVQGNSFGMPSAHHGDAAGACSDGSRTPILVTQWEDDAGSYR